MHFLKRIFLLPVLCCAWGTALGQFMVLGSNDSTDKGARLELGIYADAYYGNNFTGDTLRSIPYFVSSARNGEPALNLAYLKIRLSAHRVRVHLAPALGTYMNANYAAEPGTFRNFLYAWAGVQLSERKDLWLDAGILGSPYTNEGPISFEQPLYTRSLAAENVPYYLCGAKLSMPLSAKLRAALYLINGWQQIQDVNRKMSIGTQLEYRPGKKSLINWNTYIGDERSAARPDYRTRLFTDLYWVYNDEGRFTFTACGYIGLQQMAGDAAARSWWQLNAAARYRFGPIYSLSGRVEYFSDKDQVLLSPLTGTDAFSTASGSLCFNTLLTPHALLRVEGRRFFSDKKIYPGSNGQAENGSTWLTGSLCVSF